MKRSLAIAFVGLVPLAVNACGGDDDVASTDTSSATTAPPAASGDITAEFNEADVTFAQGMIPHHAQAVEMAEIALQPDVGARPEVVDLATRVKQAQDPEIELMTGWLSEWGQPTEMSDGHDMSSMEGMMSAEEMGALASARSAEFDQLWLEMMSTHHQGAIAMAQVEQSDGANPEAIDLAGQIVTAQQTELEEMNALLAG